MRVSRGHPEKRFRTLRLAGLFAAVLVLSFMVQFPTCYSFAFCGFYDPGTAIKGAYLLEKGYQPTVDFGYTHGLLSLEISRLWFALAGRTPAAYFTFVMLVEVFIAIGLARLAVACRLSRPAIALFCCTLPLAIIPDYLTLTHPLEALLIIHALADQAQGRRARALALLTLCIFIKPSMAYVYGFVLLVNIAIDLLGYRHSANRGWHAQWGRGPAGHDQRAFASALHRLVRALLPAIVVAVVCAGVLSAVFGVAPLIRTALAVAGTSAYTKTNFGFFAGSGAEFWRPSFEAIATHAGNVLGFRIPPALAAPFYYLTSPAGIWLLAAAALNVAAAVYVIARLRGQSLYTRRGNLLLTLALLHTAFLCGFYGWTQSWTYYAYMPFFALALIATALRLRWPIMTALCALALLAHTRNLGIAAGGWQYTVRTKDTSGLFAWKITADEWSEVLSLTTGQRTLLMTNGYPTHLPPNVELPDAWFPETGIATPKETARVLDQVRHASAVIIWREYRDLDLWNTSQFAAEKANFARIYPPGSDDIDDPDAPKPGQYFEVYQRHAPATPALPAPSTAPTPDPSAGPPTPSRPARPAP